MTPENIKCPLYKKCSGCQLQNLTYDEQLNFKQRLAEKYLNKFCYVEPIIGMYYPYHYRNKAQAKFLTAQNKKIISGIYQSSTNGIVATDSCLIEDKKSDEIIVTIRKLLKEFKISTYDERTRAGFLRHILVRKAFKTGQIMVVLVAHNPILPDKNHFLNALLKIHPEITSVILNVCTAGTNLLLGDKETVLFGKGYIEDVLCGCKFKISSRSFYQINPMQTEVLYKKAIAFAELNGTETVIDAYCGIGTIGIIASKKAKQVISAELNRQAVKDAIANAKLNSIKNINFVNMDAGQFMMQTTYENQKADVLFMDPPRAGSDENFIKAAIELSPSKIVYISCNPETQSRDLNAFVANGYTVTKIQPVDMFPQTNHVETVVLMSRVKGK